MAIVPVRDTRMEQVAALLKSSEIVWDTIAFHDIAGLVKGASEGEGLGNKFLANIRETDAIVHVVRSHTDSSILHSEGSVDPARDIETIETELIYADLEQAERRHERVLRQARGGDKELTAEQRWLEAIIAELQAGKTVRATVVDHPVPDAAPESLRNLSPLTSKPVLFVVNVDEGSDEIPPEILAHAEAIGAKAVAVSSRLEAELSEMDEEDAAEMRADLGVSESGLERVAQGAFALLQLNSFFTAGEGTIAQSWHLRDGLTAWHAAGQIHTDIQKGFVRAEVIGWDALVDAGGYAGARERGTLRVEGRDYVVLRRRRHQREVHALTRDRPGTPLAMHLPRRVDKPWGHELWYALTDRYAGKILYVSAGHRLSLQFHHDKDESNYLLSGRLKLIKGTSADDLVETEIGPGHTWRNQAGEIHTIEAIEDAQVLEVSTPEVDDVVRLSDSYGRAGSTAH